jgi:hypothetical protein
VRAEDLKLTHIQAPAAQQKVTTAKDEKATITNGSDAACKAKPDDPVVRPDTAEAASSAEKGGQEFMSRASDKSSSRESLTLHAPAQEDWAKDQIHLSAETSLGEESRRNKPDDSKPGSGLKCTPHEAAAKLELAPPN